jgi:hypothetical protein
VDPPPDAQAEYEPHAHEIADHGFEAAVALLAKVLDRSACLGPGREQSPRAWQTNSGTSRNWHTKTILHKSLIDSALTAERLSALMMSSARQSPEHAQTVLAGVPTSSEAV